jgi:outer membrane protein
MISVFALVEIGLSAGNAQAQSLEEALAKAYANHPSLLAQQARVRATDEQVEQALANWRPTATVSTAISRGTTENNTYSTPDTRNQTRTERENKLTVNQTLFRGFRTLAATDKAENRVLAERARLMGVEQTVLFDATSAYVRTVREKAILELNKDNEKSFLGQVEATTTRFKSGERTRTDVYQAEARYNKAISERRLAEGDYATALAMYQTSMGDGPSAPILPSIPAGLPSSKEEALKLAIENNPAIMAAMFDEKAADESIIEARGELLPSLGLSGSASRDFDTSSHGSRIDNAGVKLTLSMPLYDGGVAWSKVRQAKQTAHEEHRKMEFAQRSAVESAGKGWDLLGAAKKRIAAHEDQVASADAALEAIKKEMSGGTRTIVDVLDAEEELHQARVSLTKAKADQVLFAYQIKQAIGQMTAAHLNLGVAKYDPSKHYDEVRNKFIGFSSQGEEKELPKTDERLLKEKPAPAPQSSKVEEPPVPIAEVREQVAVNNASESTPIAAAPEPQPVAPSQPEPQIQAEAKAPSFTTPSPEVGKSGRHVQLSAQPSQELATAYWVKSEIANPELLAEITPRIEMADLGPGKGIVYRLRAEIPAKATSAADFCVTLKSHGMDCIPVQQTTPVAASPAPQLQAKAQLPAETSKVNSSKPSAPTGKSGGLLHISSQRTEELAAGFWLKQEAAHPDIFANLTPHIEKVNLGPGKGVFYRLFIESPKEATSLDGLCEKLKSKGLYCTKLSAR